MAIQNKPNVKLALSLDGDYPPLPDVPDEVQERFQAMEDYQREMKDWWKNVTTMLARDRANLVDQINKLANPP